MKISDFLLKLTSQPVLVAHSQHRNCKPFTIVCLDSNFFFLNQDFPEVVLYTGGAFFHHNQRNSVSTDFIGVLSHMMNYQHWKTDAKTIVCNLVAEVQNKKIYMCMYNQVGCC